MPAVVFKAVKNRKRSGLIANIAGQIDWPKSDFLQTKATHFETMMTTVDEVNRDNTKVPNFFFRNVSNVSLVCFSAELDE